jgi:hypothetical protein
MQRARRGNERVDLSRLSLHESDAFIGVQFSECFDHCLARLIARVDCGVFSL